MTDNDIRPGCFGSIIFYNVNAPECVACPVMSACGTQCATRQVDALKVVSGLDETFKTSCAPQIAERFRAVWKVLTVKRDTSTALALLNVWSANGVNVYLLKHRSNPCANMGGSPVMKETFAFMLEAVHFKVRDVVEHLRESLHDGGGTKASITTFVKLTCKALTQAHVLKEEGRGVFCLA